MNYYVCNDNYTFHVSELDLLSSGVLSTYSEGDICKYIFLCRFTYAGLPLPRKTIEVKYCLHTMVSLNDHLTYRNNAYCDTFSKSLSLAKN